jgi:hypothetical protein
MLSSGLIPAFAPNSVVKGFKTVLCFDDQRLAGRAFGQFRLLPSKAGARSTTCPNSFSKFDGDRQPTVGDPEELDRSCFPPDQTDNKSVGGKRAASTRSNRSGRRSAHTSLHVDAGTLGVAGRLDLDPGKMGDRSAPRCGLDSGPLGAPGERLDLGDRLLADGFLVKASFCRLSQS